jgi:nucleoid DNA-binding protein
MAKKNAAPTKSEILGQISKDTGLAKKQVADVMDSLSGVVKKSLKGSGLFTLPGLLKMKVVKKPATKAREGVNPFTGEKMMFKAKPASKKVRIAALKNLIQFIAQRAFRVGTRAGLLPASVQPVSFQSFSRSATTTFSFKRTRSRSEMCSSPAMRWISCSSCLSMRPSALLTRHSISTIASFSPSGSS